MSSSIMRWCCGRSIPEDKIDDMELDRITIGSTVLTETAIRHSDVICLRNVRVFANDDFMKCVKTEVQYFPQNNREQVEINTSQAHGIERPNQDQEEDIEETREDTRYTTTPQVPTPILQLKENKQKNTRYLFYIIFYPLPIFLAIVCFIYCQQTRYVPVFSNFDVDLIKSNFEYDPGYPSWHPVTSTNLGVEKNGTLFRINDIGYYSIAGYIGFMGTDKHPVNIDVRIYKNKKIYKIFPWLLQNNARIFIPFFDLALMKGDTLSVKVAGMRYIYRMSHANQLIFRHLG